MTRMEKWAHKRAEIDRMNKEMTMKDRLDYLFARPQYEPRHTEEYHARTNKD